MTQLKAYIADNHDIVKALKDMLFTTLVAALCIGIGPALIWLSTISI